MYVKSPAREGLTAFRPDYLPNKRMSDKAKTIFTDAFTTSYTAYHKESGSTDSIEKWLRLNSKFTTITAWMEATYDEKYAEFQAGTKGFIYLIDSKQ